MPTVNGTYDTNPSRAAARSGLGGTQMPQEPEPALKTITIAEQPDGTYSTDMGDGSQPEVHGSLDEALQCASDKMGGQDEQAQSGEPSGGDASGDDTY